MFCVCTAVTIEFINTPYTVSEGGGSITVVVEITGNIADPVSIEVLTVNDTAKGNLLPRLLIRQTLPFCIPLKKLIYLLMNKHI